MSYHGEDMIGDDGFGTCEHALKQTTAELTRTREALEGLRQDVRGVLDPLNWVTAAGQEVANFGIQVALRTALERATRVEKGGEGWKTYRKS